MTSEFDEIKAVRDDLLDHKLRRHRNINGAGLAKDEFGWHIKVNLIKPHRWWHRKLPRTHRGVRIRYEVVGKIYAC